MKYIVFVIDDQSGSASGDEMSAINAFNEGLRSNGHWVMAAGIGAPGTAVVLDNRDGAGIVESRSLFEGAEHYSGFWIVETADGEEALSLAREGSRACNRRVELRPFLA